jgi:hypothetical protein
MKTVVLITCGATKRDHRCKAKDLYIGGFFKIARRWVESLDVDQWYILTYDKGLIDPEKMIDPYDFTPVKKIEPEWHDKICAELKRRGFSKAIFACRQVQVPSPRPGVRYAFDEMPRRGIGHQQQYFTVNQGRVPVVKGVLK